MARISFAAQELGGSSSSPVVVTSPDGSSITVNPTPSTILAPQGLSAQEQAQLEQQYRFEYKNKASILNPFVSSAGAGTAIETITKEQSEQEKMYRYFGAAMGLQTKGRLDEAIEILKYIVDKNPGDEYVKSYLKKLMTERQFQKNQWSVRAKGDATFLKREEIKNLLRDGADYYKQKDFDRALLKFSDVLELDPGNADAKRYIAKLKDYYLKEVSVESMVDNFEASLKTDAAEDKEAPGAKTGVEDKNLSDRILDEEEGKTAQSAKVLLNKKEGPAVIASEELLEKKEREKTYTAQDILDKKETELLVKDKKIGTFLDSAELGLAVEDIITRKKEEERKSRLYTLGPGDVISISVRDHPELSGSAVVRLSGDVILPLVNDVVQVKGATIDEATQKIKTAMKRYVKDPFVTVTIADYNSKRYYVIDENGATPYPITRANLTLRDALFISDWGDNRALGRVLLVKPNSLHPVIRKIDTFDMIYRGNLAKNVKIEDGDVIYIPMTVAAKTTKVIKDTIAPFSAVRSARDEWINQKGDMKSWIELPKIRKDAADDEYQHMIWPVGGSSIGSGG